MATIPSGMNIVREAPPPVGRAIFRVDSSATVLTPADVFGNDVTVTDASGMVVYNHLSSLPSWFRVEGPSGITVTLAFNGGGAVATPSVVSGAGRPLLQQVPCCCTHDLSLSGLSSSSPLTYSLLAPQPYAIVIGGKIDEVSKDASVQGDGNPTLLSGPIDSTVAPNGVYIQATWLPASEPASPKVFALEPWCLVAVTGGSAYNGTIRFINTGVMSQLQPIALGAYIGPEMLPLTAVGMAVASAGELETDNTGARPYSAWVVQVYSVELATQMPFGTGVTSRIPGAASGGLQGAGVPGVSSGRTAAGGLKYGV